MKIVTIAPLHRLPEVRVLSRTLQRTHPSVDFAVLIVDALPTDAPAREEFDVIGPWDLDLPGDDFACMSFMYDEEELSAALKPWALRWSLSGAHDVAIYVAPDATVHGSLENAASAARDHGLALTPQRLTPTPRDGLRPTEAEIMKSGIYNVGFIAVGDAGHPWLSFWEERHLTDSVVDAAEQLFLDQRWADWAPALFDPAILRDPGLNVGYWNLDERDLQVTPEGYTSQGSPLRLARFTGHNTSMPWCLSQMVADAPRTIVSEHPALRQLLAEYDALLAESRLGSRGPGTYRYATFGDGTVITPQIRRLYRAGLIAARLAGTHSTPPPVPDIENGFLNVAEWLCEPDTRMPVITRLAYAIWASRVDLQAAFPEPQTTHSEGYTAWLRTHGVREGYVNPTWEAAVRPMTVERQPLGAEAGCGVFGYFTSVLGVGATGRLAVAALDRAGIPINVHDSSQTQSPKEIVFQERRSDVRHPINLVAMNADMFSLWVEQWGPGFARDAYTIGLWAWELESFPASMHDALDHVDEIWALSEFNAKAFRRYTSLPVHIFPVSTESGPVRPWPEWVGVDPGRGYFLFVFDYLSEVERKNPLGLIAAYLAAFPRGDGPSLIIKSLNGELRRTEREMVRQAASGSNSIRLIEDYLPAPRLEALVQHAIAFVSLHRSEGLGLGILDAMAQGTPAIATGYSGNLTFMNERNSLLIPYVLMPTPESAGYYAGLGEWADPDISAAASAMRRLVEDRSFASELGRRGQQDVIERFSADRAAQFARERVDDIMARRAQQTPGASRTTPSELGRRIAGRLRRVHPRRGDVTPS